MMEWIFLGLSCGCVLSAAWIVYRGNPPISRGDLDLLTNIFIPVVFDFDGEARLVVFYGISGAVFLVLSIGCYIGRVVG